MRGRGRVVVRLGLDILVRMASCALLTRLLPTSAVLTSRVSRNAAKSKASKANFNTQPAQHPQQPRPRPHPQPHHHPPLPALNLSLHPNPQHHHHGKHNLRQPPDLNLHHRTPPLGPLLPPQRNNRQSLLPSSQAPLATVPAAPAPAVDVTSAAAVAVDAGVWAYVLACAAGVLVLL
ncbi:hypothetical protein GQ602_004072 [Ophiocordyceps camponoti-floridani]|uniref:Uncharacterized protein n=1 Tax=Ophiocordyceps camponoti-floridani TaxID=2030778 RepID=A0A8H4VDG5_9HYPO|nr:hypothetical protein GQ602_004072 [Ophiocordyceps camponoti-floridani]